MRAGENDLGRHDRRCGAEAPPTYTCLVCHGGIPSNHEVGPAVSKIYAIVWATWPESHTNDRIVSGIERPPGQS